jgi:2-polyprenyl-3-methyl-5-hydroxy-6-metoxy-1,4-benzoquinol methylase
MTDNTGFYTNLYDKLYDTGYHNSHELSHTIPALKYLETKGFKYTSALDVGSSIGNAVKYLQDKGIDAHGTEISPIAVENAEKRGIRNCKVGTATNLEYPDGTFELVISTDVIEHLKEEDVAQAFSEMVRVSSKFIVLKPCTHVERNKVPIQKLKAKYTSEFDDIENLHLTVKPISWYKEIISHHNLEVYNKPDLDTNTLVYRKL